MGVSESTLKALTQPCHDFSKFCLDDCEFESNCSDCCKVHLRTHPHDSGSDEEVTTT
jgi:hypothetical protein